MRKNPINRPAVKSIARAADILNSLGDGAEKLTDIASRIHLSTTTTHRFLKTLEDLGFVIQDPVTHKYYLGYSIVRLSSSSAIAHAVLKAYAYDEMKYLRDLTGESVGLFIQIGNRRVILEEIPSNQNIGYVLGIGDVGPIHTGAAGYVLLSELSDRELRVRMKTMNMVSYGRYTITDKEELMKELEKTRKLGYGTAFNTVNLGGASIAVPIRNYVCPAAIGIHSPTDRFNNLLNCVKELKDAAERISRKLAS